MDPLPVWKARPSSSPEKRERRPQPSTLPTREAEDPNRRSPRTPIPVGGRTRTARSRPPRRLPSPERGRSALLPSRRKGGEDAGRRRPRAGGSRDSVPVSLSFGGASRRLPRPVSLRRGTRPGAKIKRPGGRGERGPGEGSDGAGRASPPPLPLPGEAGGETRGGGRERGTPRRGRPSRGVGPPETAAPRRVGSLHPRHEGKRRRKTDTRQVPRGKVAKDSGKRV